jgi:hypothetical protein
MSPLARAAVVSAVALAPLLVYINACGNIHESPCGFAALPAVALVLPTLFLPIASSKLLSWIGVAISTFIITTALVWLVLRVRAAARR